MGAWQAVRDVVELMKLLPQGAVPSDHVGTATPSKPQDLPAMAVALRDVRESPSSVGGLAGTQAVSADQWSERTVVRTRAVLELTMFAGNPADLDELTDATAALLGARVDLRKRGFLDFSILSISAGAERDIGRNAQAGAFARTIECSIVHEEVPEVTTGPGGLIRTVHVELSEQFNEVMDVTR